MPNDVVAAGAVVTRRGGEVLLVHRPRYDDWSFPKGKRDPGEHVVATAVREVSEETGLRVRLGPPLESQRYRTGDRAKRVHYWTARVVGDDDVSGYAVNEEIDQVRWVPWQEAEQLLSYDHDRETLAEARPLRRSTRALVVLRHGDALPRKEWRDDDRRRPLAPAGEAQAAGLVPLLAAWDVSRLVSSSSTRCVQTVTPYAAASGREVVPADGLSEEDATPEGVRHVVAELLSARDAAVLCTHRPVLPWVYDGLGVPEARLRPSDMLVVHRRRGEVLAVEHVSLA